MRNTINTALGAQKAKTNASKQAIEKWERFSLYRQVLKRDSDLLCRKSEFCKRAST